MIKGENMKKQLFVLIALLVTQTSEVYCGKAGVGIGAGLAGFAVGSAVASSNRRYSEPQYVERQVIVREQPAQTSSPDRGTIRQLESIIDDLRDKNAELKAEIRDYKNDLRQLKNLKDENKELKDSIRNLKKELESGQKESVRDIVKSVSASPAA